MRTLGASTLIAIALCAGACRGEVFDPESPVVASDPAAAVLPRLTALQYRNSLLDIFGSELPILPTPADTNPYLFYSIGATSTELSELGAQQYADAAAQLSDWLFAETSRWTATVGCQPETLEDPCVRAFLKDFGLRLFRRPLQPDEEAKWMSVMVETERGVPARGLRFAIYGMLQSPQFLYRSELGEPDPLDTDHYRYTSFEMAERLSFLLWNRAPDRDLLAAAARNELVEPAQVYEQAMRLLESDNAQAAVQDFFSQYLDLGGLDALERDPARYPASTPTLPSAMKTEIRLLVDDLVFRRDADIRELLSSRRTFVNKELAALYGVDAPLASEVAFVAVDLPEDRERAGFLTSAAFLSLNGHETDTSPTLRGKFIRERLLCELVPPPPPDVDTQVVPPSEEVHTLRERLEQHRANPTCASCHALIDPPGFLFEGFDSLGVARTEDNGYPIDHSGGLDGVPLANAQELADLLAADERVSACMVKQLYRHANGRLDQAREGRVLRELDARFAASGYRFKDLLLELALSDGFRKLAKPENAQ